MTEGATSEFIRCWIGIQQYKQNYMVYNIYDSTITCKAFFFKTVHDL